MRNQTAATPVKALVGATYGVMIVTNALANIVPINGRTTGEISDSYENLFAPAGLTFSIWGVIYVLLGAHVLYQLGYLHAPEPDAGAPGDTGEAAGPTSPRARLLTRVGVLFSLSSVANTAWILTWHYDLILASTVMLATMLVLLILLTRVIRRTVLSTRDRLLVRLPFSVYFGWITVATIANVTVWLVSIGWEGFGFSEATWALLIIAVGAVIGTGVILADRDIAYGLVLIWAYLGIWLKHTSPDGFDGAYPTVSAMALAGIGVFMVAGILVLLRRGVAR